MTVITTRIGISNFKKVNYFYLKIGYKNAKSIKEAKKMQIPELNFWYAPQS